MSLEREDYMYLNFWLFLIWSKLSKIVFGYKKGPDILILRFGFLKLNFICLLPFLITMETSPLIVGCEYKMVSCANWLQMSTSWEEQSSPG